MASPGASRSARRSAISPQTILCSRSAARPTSKVSARPRRSFWWGRARKPESNRPGQMWPGRSLFDYDQVWLPRRLLAGGFLSLLVRLALGLLLGFEILAGVLVDNLHGQASLAALVEAQELDLDLVAFLDHVGDLLHPARRQLADMHEAVLGAEEIHEGAEVHHLHDGAFIDGADLRLGGDRLDPVDRRLHGIAVGGGDLDGAVVRDVDLGAGLLHDLADHLAARADHLADLVDGNLQNFDARCVLAELRA